MSPEPIPIVVIDTVGFVRLLLNPDGPWGAIFAYYRTGYRIALSDQLASELADVLSRSKIRERFNAGPVARATIHQVLESAIWVELGDIPAVCRDPKEDNDLLDTGEHDGIRIVNAIELLRVLRG